MQSPQSLAIQAAWASAFAQPIAEFSLTALAVVSGTLPLALRGSLYRNGPSLFERNGEPIAHWFDGDGAVLGVHFNGDTATASYRRVQTAGYRVEEAAGQFKFGSYGRRLTGPFWQAATQEPKNVANTSVLPLSDRLLALWEGGYPYALDLHTLETIGLDNLGGLAPGQTFSAHPKVDSQTGEIYNFGVTAGRNANLQLYRCDRQGRIVKRSKIPLNGMPLIHDFVLAGPYLLFFISPVYVNLLPLLLHWQSYSEALRWRPQRGTKVLVVDRNSLEPTCWGEASSWFQWHFGNGYVNADGQVVVDVVRYPDFQTNQFLQEVPSGQPHTIAPSTLWRLRVNPQTAQVIESVKLSDRTCEFPSVNPHLVGQAARYTYLSVRSDDAAMTDVFDAIACFDHQQGEMTLADLGGHRYPSEPIFAPHPQNSDQGWLLSVVYDGDRQTSEIWIFDNQNLQKGPVCCLALPQVVAFGFHGTWEAA